MIPLSLLILALLVFALLGDAFLRILRFKSLLPPWQYPFLALWLGQALGVLIIWLAAWRPFPCGHRRHFSSSPSPWQVMFSYIGRKNKKLAK